MTRESRIPLAEALRSVLGILVMESRLTEFEEEGRSQLVLLECLDCTAMLAVDDLAVEDLSQGLRATGLKGGRCWWQNLNKKYAVSLGSKSEGPFYVDQNM
jgi:hypothetical protein